MDDNIETLEIPEENIINKKNNYRKIIVYTISILLLFVLFIFLLKNSIELNSYEMLNYNESGNIDYKVFLKENNYYQEKYLTKNNKYIADLIDKIEINYNYSLAFNKVVDCINNYYIDSEVVVRDIDNPQKTIYKNREKLIKNKTVNYKNSKVVNLMQSIDIDYNKYNKIAESFKKEYQLASNSYLKVYLYTDTNYRYYKFLDNKVENGMLMISIPLATKTIDINTYDKESNSNRVIKEKTGVKITNYLLLFVGTIIFILIVCLLIMLYREIKFQRSKTSSYERKLKKIIREYDRVIVESTNLYFEKDYNIIDVTEFSELLDVKEGIDSPIVHYEINSKKSIFTIRDNNDLYRYILEEK